MEALLGLAAFLVALAIHVVVWRIRVPPRPLGPFAVIFAGVLLAVVIAYAFLVEPRSLWGGLYLLLEYCSLVGAYLIAYTAIAYDSPALSLTYELGSAGAQGRSDEDLRAFIERRPFLASRLRQLYHDDLLRKQNGMIEMTPRARGVLRGYDRIRFLLGHKRVGG